MIFCPGILCHAHYSQALSLLVPAHTSRLMIGFFGQRGRFRRHNTILQVLLKKTYLRVSFSI